MEDAGSPLKALGSFAQNHFELHDINPYFLFAFWTVKREFNKNSIFTHLCPGFTAADGTANPSGTILFFVHSYHTFQ